MAVEKTLMRPLNFFAARKHPTFTPLHDWNAYGSKTHPRPYYLEVSMEGSHEMLRGAHVSMTTEYGPHYYCVALHPYRYAFSTLVVNPQNWQTERI